MVSKSKKICSYIFTGILFLSFILVLAACIFLPLFNLIALLITIFILLLITLPKFFRKRPSLFTASLVCLIILTVSAMFWSIFHAPFIIKTKWQYPAALTYVYGSVNKSTVLPQKLPESAENINCEFLPTMLQGSGHMCVEFTADDSYIQNLKDELKSDSMYIVKYCELGELNASLPAEDSDYGGFKEISLWEGSFTKEHPDATVYIIYTNYNWNHPRSKAVFIDGNYVFFSDQ